MVEEGLCCWKRVLRLKDKTKTMAGCALIGSAESWSITPLILDNDMQSLQFLLI